MGSIALDSGFALNSQVLGSGFASILFEALFAHNSPLNYLPQPELPGYATARNNTKWYINTEVNNNYCSVTYAIREFMNVQHSTLNRPQFQEI